MSQAVDLWKHKLTLTTFQVQIGISQTLHNFLYILEVVIIISSTDKDVVDEDCHQR